MASTFRISVDLSDLLAVGPLAKAGVFANLSYAVQTTVDTGVARWREEVQSASLWEGEKTAYAASISGRMLTPFSGEITSDYQYVEDIESGRPPYDLKRMLQTSSKVRTSKKGKRYLVIPFRHNTPGSSAMGPAMPKAVYAQARNLEASTISSSSSKAGGRAKYIWGGRLGKQSAFPRQLARHGPGLTRAAEHKSGRYDGMVRMDTSTGKSKSSAYLTFRVMIEGSSGWILPARPGQWIAKKVADNLQRTADVAFPAAVARDIMPA